MTTPTAEGHLAMIRQIMTHDILGLGAIALMFLAALLA